MKSRSTSELKGVYANYFEVGHTAIEIVLDFGERYGSAEAPCHTRVVTSPIYAQALLETLRKSLDEYTASFGALHDPGDHGDIPSNQ